MKKYNTIVSGGTFDHFHKGHEAFIEGLFAISDKVLIGITSDSYIQEHKGESIESYETRALSVKKFLKAQNVYERVEIEEINDLYIPSRWENYNIDAIGVTNDTKQGAEYINSKKKEEGLEVLPIEVIPEIIAEDGKAISSQRIRNGEINREGILYIDTKCLKHILYLPETLRSEIKKPFGIQFATIDTWMKQSSLHVDRVISIGDVVTQRLREKKFYPKIVVVDLIVQRKQFFSSLSQHKLDKYAVVQVNNPAGSITPALFQAAQKSIKGDDKTIIHVTGEEDLAVLPFVLAAPLGYVILYGQPQSGVIAIEVTEEKKNQTKKLVEKFTF